MSCARRIVPFLAQKALEDLESVHEEILQTARSTPVIGWRGKRQDLYRYSGRQKTELEFRGVTGHLDLPKGPGSLFPLLAAAQWLHLGKATTVGLGKLTIEQLI